MADQDLKDRNGRKFAVIRTLSNGTMDIFQYPQMSKKGSYNPKTNETREYPSMRLVGKGNLLAMLVKQ